MKVQLATYPQLRLLAWNRAADAWVEEVDALALYEREWRHVDQHALTPDEKAFIEHLAQTYGNGVLNV
ncbi:conserved hypothetical protein [Xanthomonas citri pv. citri]|uniref:hypothetical protein n=1 Tax=Xanthomonas citri TaxID=346 RepID=UPI00052B5BD7|nr:hypothetical protein [Xanthomonas citri]CEE84469.1 conserved hypothetical protein [Xanthomonas citri pv. citri]CEH59887.1 conserved hypothetical protein [Xanthomonas citri pv. citri]